jgi:hypothetical protein
MSKASWKFRYDLKQFIPQSLSAAEKPVGSNIGRGSNG